MRIQLDVNAVAAFQWEISGFSKLGNEITPGPPPRFGCYRWNLSVHSKGLEDGAGSHMSAFLETHGTEEQVGDDTSICPDFAATPPNESAQPRSVTMKKSGSADRSGISRNIGEGRSRFVELEKIGTADGFVKNDTVCARLRFRSFGSFIWRIPNDRGLAGQEGSLRTSCTLAGFKWQCTLCSE